MDVTVLAAKSGKKLCVLSQVDKNSSIGDLKNLYQAKYPAVYTSRQSFRSTNRGKSLKDSDKIIEVCPSGEIFFKDLGPQIGWSTVFYAEYAGPLFLYLLFYLRIPYGSEYAFTISSSRAVHVAAACHSFHYLKRLLETMFVHRFSHGTMPIGNLFKNCTYYWLFACWQAYLINHPQYTAPAFGDLQVNIALFAFMLCQFGNFSIHMLQKNLRKPGTKQRQIPFPNSNPMTGLFNLVSCPNYTYEVGSWISFAVMSQCLASVIFAALGFYQMTVWALGKHRNYKKEFDIYPRNRKAIVPFFI